MPTPKRVLILFAHPALQRSSVNARLIRAVRDLPGVTVDDLYERYPDFMIDVPAEQALLLEHDVIVLHHPFYWYSSPAILKEWQDLVLEYGFAYGEGGTALDGKFGFSVISTGGSRQAYRRDGHNHFEIAELLTPFEQTFRLCHMEYLPPFVIHGTHELKREADVMPHAQDYVRLIESLTEDRVDIEAARTVTRLNDDLTRVIREEPDHGA